MNFLQSINRSTVRRNNPSIKPVIDFHEMTPSIILGVFSAAYLPINTASISLVNFPTKKAGIINNGFILAIPPAINNGVVGNGNKEYVRIIAWLLHPFSFSLAPRNWTSSFLEGLKILFATKGMYKVKI